MQRVVTDLVMRGIHGREFGARAAEIMPQVPVLYMSAYAEDEVAHRGMLAPGTPLLRKPFTPGVLARKVRELLDASGGRPRRRETPTT